MVDTNFYITRMQVYNLFGKENIDWELRQDVNILGGINGSGKSTLLKCGYSLLHNGFLDAEQTEMAEGIENHTHGLSQIQNNGGHIFSYIPLIILMTLV